MKYDLAESGPHAPRCLVLLAAYNGAEHIRQQIESILSQQCVDVELVIADDASSDATAAIAAGLAQVGKIHVHRRFRGTGSAAQNFAQLVRETDATDADYVALSDQDDVWMTDKLQRATSALASNGAGGYSSSVIARWPDGTHTEFHQSSQLRAADFLFEGAGQGCTFVLTRAFFQAVQEVFRLRPDLTQALIYHDWAIYALARSLDVPWLFDHQPSLWYRQHAGNDTGARRSWAGIRRRVRLILNGQYRSQVSAVTSLCYELTPNSRIVNQWKGLQLAGNGLTRRIHKALFCYRHGRRKLSDRTLTAVAALAGWI